MRKIIYGIFLLIFIIGCSTQLPDKEVKSKEAIFTNAALPNVELCKNTEDGWQCRLTLNDSFNYDENQTAYYNRLNKELEAVCNAQGGVLKCYGYCMPSYGRYCRFPLEDAGKKCSDMLQCKGWCIPDDLQCGSNCSGTCSEYVVSECERKAKLVNGKVVPNQIICD